MNQYVSGKLVLFSTYNQNDQVKENQMGRACSTNAEKMNAYMILVGKPGGKRLLGRTRRRLVDNINMDLREREREREDGVVWAGLIWFMIVSSGGLL
jgi:hypothetical protein